MTLTVVRTETQAKQRKKEKQNMAITLSDIHNAYVDYFSSRVVTSITVAPLSGQAHINPNEQFNITLEVKNSADDPAQGFQINNVCYHVSVDGPADALLIIPDPSVAVNRKSADKDADLDPPPGKRQELFLFPPVDTLEAGATGSPLPIQGLALAVGAQKLSFHVHGVVKIDALLPPNQKSTNAHQTVEIESS
jgi:hypothetical protein